MQNWPFCSNTVTLTVHWFIQCYQKQRRQLRLKCNVALTFTRDDLRILLKTSYKMPNHLFLTHHCHDSDRMPLTLKTSRFWLSRKHRCSCRRLLCSNINAGWLIANVSTVKTSSATPLSSPGPKLKTLSSLLSMISKMICAHAVLEERMRASVMNTLALNVFGEEILLYLLISVCLFAATSAFLR